MIQALEQSNQDSEMMVERLQTQHHALSAFSAELDRNTSQTVSSSKEAMGIYRDMSASLLAQTESIQTLFDNIQQVYDKSDKMDHSARLMQQESDESARILLDMKQSFNDLKSSIDGVNQSFLVTSAIQRELEEETHEIGLITEAIENIANQTQILALNANIEAAHAGPHGKGFRVVADEVKDLADEAHESTLHISALLKTIIEKINRSARETRASQAALEQSESRASSMEDALGEVLIKSDAVKREINDVTHIISSVKQSLAVIHEEISIISGISEENSATLSDFHTSLDRVSRMLHQVSDDFTQMQSKMAHLS